ncbi:MAG: hypothetical protein MJ116_05845 [Lachnospiraceae bacterium]|nr:hypothetical protein [Lachnospiraceae bacterium]
MPWWGILLIILALAGIALFFLYRAGKKAQAQKEEQMEQMEAAKQTISMLVIDKKKLPLKDSGLPQMVIDQTPKRYRRQKLPIVKAKVGSRIMILIAEPEIFDIIPVKKEVKATVSGLYILSVKGARGALPVPPKAQKKETWLGKLLKKGRGEA